MKTFTLALSLAVLNACGGKPDPSLPAPTIALAAGTSTLRVEVAGVHSALGMIDVALFNAADGFPGPSPIIGGAREAKANGGTLIFEFTALPAGTYAVSMQHDENGNGKLDTSLVGAPIEGYGITNNITHATSAPTFEESKVELAAGQVLQSRINVKY